MGWLWLGAAALLVLPGAVRAAEAGADGSRFHEIYRELVETDTTLSSGSCTAASQRMAARLRAGGVAAQDIHLYSVPDHPKEGGLVAVARGADHAHKGLLFLAHIDVVEAPRSQWATDPFVLVESGGYFRARGVSDDKANAAALIDLLIRFKAEGFAPRRTIKVALTCGEETPTAFNGARYLARARRDLVDADMAFAPSGGGVLDATGRPVSLAVQAGEKVQQDYLVEATGTGSHGSRPTTDNAIYTLAAALLRLSRHPFPVRLNPVTAAYLRQTAATADPAAAAAIRALLADPEDGQAQQALSADPAWNAMLRTTCVATLLNAGAGANTIPAKAQATLNCRLLPDQRVEDVAAVLDRVVVAQAPVTVTALPPAGEASPPPPLTAEVLRPIEQTARALWPGVAIVPTMLTGATDARHFNAVGIPAYGLTTVFNDPDGDGVHAANERVRISAVEEGREFLYLWIKRISSAAGP